jgi:hypothetical protein
MMLDCDARVVIQRLEFAMDHFIELAGSVDSH